MAVCIQKNGWAYYLVAGQQGALSAYGYVLYNISTCMFIILVVANGGIAHVDSVFAVESKIIAYIIQCSLTN